MTEKITQLKKLVEAGKFQELFDYLDLYFEDNPYNQYSTLKMNILHQINMGFAPNPMQVQGLQIFLNSSKIKEVIPIIAQKENKYSTQNSIKFMQMTKEEIENIKKIIDVLIEKKNFLLEQFHISYSAPEKFSLKKQLEGLEIELEDYREKLSANQIKSEQLSQTQKAQEEIEESLKEEKKTSVFISYNHNDKDLANRIKDFLRKQGIDVTIDSEAMKAGEDIKTFIEKCVKENDVTLSLVSKNSLLSAWVAMESVLTFAGEKLTNKKFIAVYEDASFFDITFTDDALDVAEERIKLISETIQNRLSKNRRIEDLQSDLSRYKELENNLPQIIGRLRNSLCIDISGNNFEKGMQKVSDDIK